MTNLDSIFKSRDITLPTKVRLVKAMVFPVVMYGCARDPAHPQGPSRASCVAAYPPCAWDQVGEQTAQRLLQVVAGGREAREVPRHSLGLGPAVRRRPWATPHLWVTGSSGQVPSEHSLAQPRAHR